MLQKSASSRARTIQILYFSTYWSPRIECSVSVRHKFSIPLRSGSCTGQSYQGSEGEIFHCPMPSHLEDFPGRLGPHDWISNYYACSRLLRDLHFNAVFSEGLRSFLSGFFVKIEVLYCSFICFVMYPCYCYASVLNNLAPSRLSEDIHSSFV